MHSSRILKSGTVCAATLIMVSACGPGTDVNGAKKASQVAPGGGPKIAVEGATAETPDPGEVPPHCVPSETPVLLRGKAPKGGGTQPPTPPSGGLQAPQFGAPPLKAGLGPDTKDTCGEASAALPGAPSDPGVVRTCFGTGGGSTPQATVERVLENVDDVDYVHVRLTFNPHFVDNSYGTTSIGWENSKNKTHTYKDLVGSDHAELLFTNGKGDVAMHIKADYISLDASRSSGYGALGVVGGEGKIFVGNASHVLAAVTSLDRNLNACGYGAFTENSPSSNAAFAPNPATPNWDYRVVYELWIAAEAFGSTGFGQAYIEYVHASPSKTGSNTLIVDEQPCPPNPPETPDPPDGTPPGGTPPGGTPPGGTPPGGTPPGGTPPGGTPPGGMEPPPSLPPCPPGYEPETPETPDPDPGPTPETPDPEDPPGGPTPETPDGPI